MYKRWLDSQAEEEVFKTDEEKFNELLREAASTLDIAQTMLGDEDKLYKVRCDLQTLIEDDLYNEE